MSVIASSASLNTEMLERLEDRLGLDNKVIAQADDPAGYSRRWRIRTGRVTSVMVDVSVMTELIALARVGLAAQEGEC